MALPIGVLLAIYVSEFAPQRVGNQARLWLDVLNGFPSIVIGIFVFALLSRAVTGKAAIAGAFALAIIMLPLVARTTMEMLATRAEPPARSELRARRLEVADRAQRRSAERSPAGFSPGRSSRSLGQPARRRRSF